MNFQILQLIDGAKAARGLTVIIDVFPTKDFAMCTDVNRFDFVLKLEKLQSDLPYMTRIYL